ncbi:MAG TPA: hypothetical protein PKY59_25030 [Pyrinomonadaceae bacterium]|nr:hypothetical protein [Pyrinomonadaceae bacterium]
MSENEENKSKTVENIEAVGQIILGEVEKIGGILTGDPVTQAEGDYNVEAGNLHHESAEALDEADGGEAAKAEN